MSLPSIRQQLEVALKEIEELKASVNSAQERMYQERDAKTAAVKQRDETRAQFDDLKKRLHESEMENQRLRGYIQRVQEDDVVREDLVAVGDPDGEMRQVPKRKSTVFAQPVQYTDFDPGFVGYSGYHNRDRPKPKHWIEY